MDWYISKHGVKEGPYSQAQIGALIEKGRLTSNDLGWRFGLSGWTPLCKLSELRTASATRDAGDNSTDPLTVCFPHIAKQDSYVIRHWRGELSLPVSFWINGNLLSLMLIALVLAVASTDAITNAPRWFSAGGVAYWSLLITMTLWQLVGVWRSASNYLRRGKSKCWGRLTKAMVIISVLASTLSVVAVGLPQMMEFAQLAVGRDPIGSYQLRLLRDGTELEMSGAIVFGLADEVARTLNENPKVKMIHLSSQGGRVGEARKLRDLIDARQLVTFTAAGCFSACTLAYAAGKQRLIGRAATLGFHQYAFPGVHQNAFRQQYEKDKNDWLARGFDRAFVQRAYATRHDELWQPPHRELFRARFVTGYPDNGNAVTSNIQDTPR